MFSPPDWVSYAPVQYHTPYDPVGDLRKAISAGRAHDDGQTEIAGRTVERIRIDYPHPSDCRPFPTCGDPEYAYVDPKSYDLVQWESPYGLAYVPDRRAWQFSLVDRYLT